MSSILTRVRAVLASFRVPSLPDNVGLHGWLYDGGFWLVCALVLVLQVEVPSWLPLGHIVLLYLWTFRMDSEDIPAARSRLGTIGPLYSLLFLGHYSAQVFGVERVQSVQIALFSSVLGYWTWERLRSPTLEDIEAQVLRLNERFSELNQEVGRLADQLASVPDEAMKSIEKLGGFSGVMDDAAERTVAFTLAVEEASDIALSVLKEVLEKLRRTRR